MILDKPNESKVMEFRNPDAGSYLGRCISVIDLGHQKTVWDGIEKMSHKILLNFELFGDDSKGALEIDNKPLVVYKRYTLSNHDKSGLMADLKGWMGKVELPLNFESLLGKFALVNVVHNEYQGKIYANISGLTQVPSMLVKNGLPQGVNNTFMYHIKAHPKNFDLVWGWQQEMVKRSSEFGSKEVSRETVMIDDDVPF
jgi:hypothetical protein